MKWIKSAGDCHITDAENGRKLLVVDYRPTKRCDWFVWESDGNTLVARGSVGGLEQAKQEAEGSAE